MEMFSRINFIIKFWLFAIILGFFTYQFGISQTKTGFPVSVFNVEQGLSQSSINDIFQDKQGLIWLVTGDGMQYFDGSDFRTYFMPDDLINASLGHSIYAIAANNDSSFFVSTGKNIVTFNRFQGTFQSMQQPVDGFPILFDTKIEQSAICWLMRKGLYRADYQQLNKIRIFRNNGTQIPENFIPNQAVKTRSGTLLLSSTEGILQLKPVNNESDTVFSEYWTAEKMVNPWLCNAFDGSTYLLRNGDIERLNDKGNFEPLINTGISGANYLFIDHQSNFWISDYTHNKVFKISNKRIEEICFIQQTGHHTDTLHPRIRMIHEDYSGNLWFGTDGNGLLLHVPNVPHFDRAVIGFTRCISLYNNNIWAGTFKNGLWELSPDLSNKTRINADELTDKLYFFDLMTDTYGRIWASTQLGLYVLNNRGKILYHKTFESSTAKFHILPGKAPLLSTYDKLYICETGTEPLLKEIREHTNFKDLHQYANAYWVANQFGIFRQDTLHGLQEALLYKAENRISDQAAYCLIEEGDSIWAGTESGIECFDTQGNVMTLPDYLNVLKHENIYTLLKDKQQRIWFSSNKGLGCIDASHENLIRFTIQNNLQSTEYNFNASAISKDNRIILGGINGINSINANEFQAEYALPDVNLITLIVSDSINEKLFPYPRQKVNIDRRAAHISGKVFSSSYLPPEMLQYSFFLEGYQQNWSKASQLNTFSYRNLPPGNYQLWVRCHDNYNHSGKEILLLRFVIDPPFWKTIWFGIVVAIICILILTQTIRIIQSAQYNKKLRDLEHRNNIDRERLRISQDMHDEIGASLTQVSILSEILKQKYHDPDESIRLIKRISGISGNVIDDLDEIIWAMNPKNDSLDSFASYVRKYTSEYLETAGIAGLFDFPQDYPPILMTSEQRRNVFLVIKEAVHNIVKHSRSTEARFYLKWSDNQLKMKISDNGTGFNPVDCESKGNGLGNMQKRIQALGGNYSICSQPENGTEIEFSVSLAIEKHTKRG